MLSRKLMRTLVKKDSTNQLRHFSDIPISTLITGGGLFFGAIAAYSSLGIWVLKLQLLPLQKQSAEIKQCFDKLEMKLDMKFDVLSKEIKESNDKINSRVDSVLLRSLDLQRGAKPASE